MNTLIRKYYLERRKNCAETILRAFGEVYGLNITETEADAIRGFGGGMGCGSTCGALAGAIAVLGRLYKTSPAYKDGGLKDECAKLVKEFEQKLGTTVCQKLQEQYRTDEERCVRTVELAAEVLEAHIRMLNGESEEKITVTSEDIKRVKALGFLHCKGTNNFNCRVITRNGIINNDEIRCITEAAKKYGDGRVALTTRLTMEIQGVPYENIDNLRAFLTTAGLSSGGTGSKVRPVVACKGTTCQYGLYDTNAISREIHTRFFEGYANVKLPHKFKIALGGCPNNCVKPNLNDIGIVGQRIPQFASEQCKGCKTCAIENSCPIGAAKLEGGKLVIDAIRCNHCGRCVGKCPFKAMDNSTYGYKICIGGRWGKSIAVGQYLNKVFTDKNEVFDVVEKAILLFREQGQTGERFSDTIERIGFENVEKQLLSNELLERKADILGADLHLVGGATC